MDRATVRVESQPVQVTIGLDPVVSALMVDVRSLMGMMLDEMREMRRVTAEAAQVTLQAHQERMRYEMQMADLAKIMSRGETPPTAGQLGLQALDTADDPNLTAQRNEELARHGIETAAPATVVPEQPELIDPNALDFFVGQDGGYYIRGANGEPDRRVTPRERAAIDGMQPGTKRRKR